MFAIWFDESFKVTVETIATLGNFSLLDLVCLTLKKVNNISEYKQKKKNPAITKIYFLA